MSQSNQFILGQNPVLKKNVTFSCENASVDGALLMLADSAQVKFSIANNLKTSLPNVSIKHTTLSLEDHIRAITKGAKLTIETPENGNIVIRISKLLYQISGKIIEKNSEETLPGATVAVYSGQNKIDEFGTDVYGYFAYSFPPGKYIFKINYSGYGLLTREVIVSDRNEYLGYIPVSTEIFKITEITIVDSVGSRIKGRTDIEENGQLDLRLHDNLGMTQKLPGGDIRDAVAQTPGVLSGVDGLGGVHIRGGNTDQNLFLLDDVPVYNPYHALGMFSVFNSGTVKSSLLWKGNMPARYGGRAASVIDIRTKDGDLQHYGGGLSFNTFVSSVYLQGPIVKNKSAFFVSARHTFFNPLIHYAARKNNVLNADFRQLSYKFYDITAKFQQKLGQKDRLICSYYQGGDEFMAPIIQRTDAGNAGVFFDTINLQSSWGNIIGAARWNHIWGDNAISNTTFSYTRFKYNSHLSLTSDNITPDGRQTRISNFIQLYNTDIRDWAMRHDFSWYPANNIKIEAGFNAILHSSNPGAISVNFLIPGQTNDIIDSLKNALLRNKDLRAFEFEYYWGGEWHFREHFTFNFGTNSSVFLINNTHHSAFLPRLSLYYINKKTGFRYWGTYSEMAQYMHQIGSFNIGLPFELWVPSTKAVLPELVSQYSVGAGWGNEEWGVSAEVYHKDLKRVLVLRSVTESLINGGSEESTGWENRILSGTGSSQGLELLAEKKRGYVKGMVAYTLSKTDRTFPDINQGKTFPFQFDRRHDLKASLTGTFTKWMSISLTGDYYSGNPITLALVKYNHQTPDPDITQKPREVFVYGDINGYRLPWVKRMDIAANFYLISHIAESTQKHQIQLSVYNVFNRKNPFYQVLNVNSSKTKNAIQYTLLPIMPFINYELTF